jgi:hypothetical protein
MGLTDYAKRAKEQGRVWWSDSWIERQLAGREVRRPHAPAGDVCLAPDARLVRCAERPRTLCGPPTRGPRHWQMHHRDGWYSDFKNFLPALEAPP